MAFPSVIVECAFDNDVNEYLYAQTGYTDISPWVRSISGDLRGRRYEMDSVEAGTLAVVLDNSDGRFTPSNENSPYYPYIKPSRRFRVRGQNLQRPNIATAGSTLRNTRGFTRGVINVSALPTDPALVATSGAGGSFRPVLHTNEIPDPATTALTNWTAGTGTTVTQVGDGWHRLTMTAASTGTNNPKPTAGLRFPAVIGNRLMSRVRVRGHATKTLYARMEHVLYDSTAIITGGTNGTYVAIPPNEEVVLTLVSTASNAATQGWFPLLRIAGSLAGGNAAISDYLDHTEWYAEHGTLAPTTDYYFTGDYPDSLNADGLNHGYSWIGTANSSGSQEYSHPITATHHIEVTLPTGSAANEYGLVSWNVPIEMGRRLTHSAYVWLVSGTEPAGGYMMLKVTYYDADGVALSVTPTSVAWNLPNTVTPQRRSISHTPPVNAAYAICTLYLNNAGATTTNCVYAVEGIQTNNSPNLLPNPTGAFDADWWFVTGTSNTVPTTNLTDGAVEATMAASGDSELYTYVPGLVPGEQYTVAIELRHFTAALGQPSTSLRLTADDGQTYVTVPGQTGYSTATLTFTAASTSQKISIQMSDGSDFLSGWVVRARKGSLVQGTSSGGLYTYGDPVLDLVPWEAPKPIFEGWTEAWPMRVQNEANEVTINVNDRLRRIGGITLDNTWRESEFADQMELIIPFDDDPVDAAGKVAQVGTWASLNQLIEVPVKASKGDIGTANYVLGVDGPTSATAVEMNPVSTSDTQGYFWPIPFSKDYTTPTTPTAPKPTPKPPATTPTYTVQQFTKRYYATWSRTYDGDGSTTWDDNALMYQGYYDTVRGHTRSLAGFNWTAIKADLTGATIKSCKATVMNEESYAFGGSTVYVGTHTYSSKPATWNTANVTERRASAKHAYGADSVTVELGVTAGNEFKSGSAKGIAIGPAISNDHYYYAKYRGATQAGRPYLTITFTKRV